LMRASSREDAMSGIGLFLGDRSAVDDGYDRDPCYESSRQRGNSQIILRWVARPRRRDESLISRTGGI
jgi:hypothetical protein